MAEKRKGKASEGRRFDLHLKDLFSDIFKKHSRTEKEELFICGTGDTTPSERSMIARWPRPWLHTRVFLVLLLLTLVLMLLSGPLKNSFSIPSLLFAASLMAPFSLAIFFWECNIPRNISFVHCLLMFFLGGAGAWIIDTCLENLFFLDMEKLGFFYGFLIALFQFVPVALAMMIIIRMRAPRYIMNGICIGSCGAAGFAMLIFAGRIYMNDINFTTGYLFVDKVCLQRFFRNILLSLCTMNCGAITGAAMVGAMEGEAFTYSGIKSLKFIGPAAASFLIYALYANYSFTNGKLPICLLIILVSAAGVLYFISKGLRQCVKICSQAWEREAAEYEEAEEDI